MKLLLYVFLSASIIYFVREDCLTNQKLNELQPHFLGKVIILERAAINVKLICTSITASLAMGLKLSQKRFKRWQPFFCLGKRSPRR